MSVQGERSMDKDLHKGHRARMNEKYRLGGSDVCADHELLEMLLYYALPRVNTNERAIRLLRRFGSLKAVLSASPSELATVDGIGEKSACLIHLCGDIAFRAQTTTPQKSCRFQDLDAVGEYCVKRLGNLPRERVIVLLLNTNNELLACENISDGAVNMADVNIRQIIEYAILRRAAKIVLAHNHPDGDPEPSDSDASTTLLLHRACMPLDIELTEHILVANGRYHFIIKQMRAMKLPD